MATRIDGVNVNDAVTLTITQLVVAGSSGYMLVPKQHKKWIFIGVTVGGGAVGYAEYTGSSPAACANDTAIWHQWAPGPVASGFENSDIVGNAMIAIRFTQTGAGTVDGEISY